MIVVISVCVAVTLLVLILSLVTINKGYAYKQTVDPLPGESIEAEQVNQQKEKD
ncbi:YtzI protein [Aquibacillus kalidii]|uniref:YtzI protein n=1 Tax=Aquibacillus kalidii TaxID=2762597 RepID=UPI001645FE8A|nr:YtzI protein [Aquibacillus kalidii]